MSGDGFWKRALSGLPVALADGLRTAELDDPTVLTSYPRMDWEEAVSGLRALSCTMLGGIFPAPSGVASSSHSSMSASDLRAGIALCSSSWSAASAASGAGYVGGDPRTDQALFVQDTGGDPKTDHFVPETGGDPKTDHFVPETGGDPRTDQASLNDENLLCREMAATCPPYRPGRLATATANSSASASAVLATVDDELSDGLPCMSPVRRDELPSSVSLKREANPQGSSLLDRILQKKYSIGILRDFHTGESSESLWQSQLDQVQIVPPTLIPSELSAHQMAARSDGSLALSRVDGHPISALSLQDKVLLRKYSILVSADMSITAAETSLVQSERDEGTIRSEGSQKAEDIPRMEQTVITGFDSISRDPIDPSGQVLSSSSKDSELPNAVEADPKRRRKIGKAGIKKEPKEDSESKSDLNIAKFHIPSWCQNTPLDARDFSVVRKCGVTDMVLLYITLVSDRAIPAGFLTEFLTLEQSLNVSSKRAINIAASLSDAEAERLLVLNKKQRDTQILNSSSASDLLVLAAELKPRKFRSKWQRTVYEGSTARKDMENAERSRWVASLGDLLRHTDTPMGRLLRENPIESAVAGIGT